MALFDSIIKLMHAAREVDLAGGFNRVTRPVLTLVVCVLFNVVCAVAYFTDGMAIDVYIQTVGPMNGVIVGFWFASQQHEVKGPDDL